MKGMKGRFLKTLKSIPTISTLKQGLILQFNPLEKFPPPVYKEQEVQKKNKNLQELVPGNTGISEFVKDLKDEETESSIHVRDAEKLAPPTNSNDSELTRNNSEVSVSFESASDDLQNSILLEAGVMEQNHEANENNEELYPSLLDFEEKCPPGGFDEVILYTTSMRGIRKTFEECSSIRFLLESLRVLFIERDVSMHGEFREELWGIMGGRVVPPKLFIKGRYIGGADEVIGLHEQGKLRKLLQGMPLNQSKNPCNGCAGVRFVLCFNCNGSRKVFTEEGNDESFIRCHQCNENGLVKCPICC